MVAIHSLLSGGEHVIMITMHGYKGLSDLGQDEHESLVGKNTFEQSSSFLDGITVSPRVESFNPRKSINSTKESPLSHNFTI
jgi:hypothetical protein